MGSCCEPSSLLFMCWSPRTQTQNWQQLLSSTHRKMKEMFLQRMSDIKLMKVDCNWWVGVEAEAKIFESAFGQMGMCSTEVASECRLKQHRPVQTSTWQDKNGSLYVWYWQRKCLPVTLNYSEFLTLHQLYNCWGPKVRIYFIFSYCYSYSHGIVRSPTLK